MRWSGKLACAFYSATVVLLLAWAAYAQAPSEKQEAKSQAAPVTITALGNKLVIRSEDPEALRLLSELASQLMATPIGPGDFEVIRLKFVNAVDVAKELDEMFNGPPMIGGNGARGSTKAMADASAALAALASGRKNANLASLQNLLPKRENRIRIVADQAINALVVQASPLDMLTIRHILADQLDTGETDSEQIIKTFVVGPLKYAYATDVANVIRDVYRESMDNNRRRLGQSSNPFTGATRSPTLNIDPNGNPKGVTLSLGIDDKTNSIIVACPTAMYQEIKQLTNELEVAAANTKQTVKIVRIPGLDPSLIQQALSAMQGRPTSTSAASTRSANGYAGQNGGGGGNRGNNFVGTGLAPGNFMGNFQRGNGNGYSSATFTSAGNRGGGRGNTSNRGG